MALKLVFHTRINMNNDINYIQVPNVHCCICTRVCGHVGGPFYCVMHNPNSYNTPIPVPTPYIYPAVPNTPTVPYQPLAPLLPQPNSSITILSNEALLLQQLLEEMRKISDSLSKLVINVDKLKKED